MHLRTGVKSVWRLATLGVMGPLTAGAVPPAVSDVIVVGGTALLVTEIVDLKVKTGDLPALEPIFPRRIYQLPSGSRVVFKRVEQERIVLWSYAKNCEVAVNSGIDLVFTEDTAAQTAGKSTKLTQKVLAAWLIRENPDISAQDLSDAILAQFPNCRVGKRHGSHYLCLSRNGRLPEPPDSDPRE